MSSLYGRPPGGGSKKVVIGLAVVVAVLVGLVLFLWLKPASNDTTAATPRPGLSPAPTSNPAVSGATTATGAAGSAQKGSGQWTIPVPGDGGPSTKSAAGVPRGYDNSDAGATKAAVNAVVAARWMKFQVTDPANTLAPLAVPDEGADRDAVLRQLTPGESINVGTGKKETEQSPPGGKVLGAHLLRRDAKTAVVQVLWEEFGKPASRETPVSVGLIEVRLERMQDDWLISYLDRTSLGVPSPKDAGAPFGQIDETMPVPREGWYW